MINKKEDNEIKKENLIDLCGAPILQLNNIYYNCSECSSIIEIISIDNNNIEFKCNNKHIKKMNIKEYLNKMKKYNNKNINDKICNIHNKEYFSYCFDCNIHLCQECIKLKIHNYHYKIYLMEIIPENKILNNIYDNIKKNKNIIDNLKKEKINKENKLKDILNNNINKIKDKEINTINKNKKEENDKINKYRKEYHNEIKQLKLEYENKIKEIKLKYKKI